jgi:23S rRNA pseudouridine2457 synthase
MTASGGYTTLRLVRWRIGGWEIGELAVGAWREVVS